MGFAFGVATNRFLRIDGGNGTTFFQAKVLGLDNIVLLFVFLGSYCNFSQPFLVGLVLSFFPTFRNFINYSSKNPTTKYNLIGKEKS